MRVLMVTHPLPDEQHPGTMAPAARQIRSIAAAGVEVQIVEVRGLSKVKYVQVRPRLLALLPEVDLVHAHFGYCGWLALSQRRRPVVVSFMGDDLLGSPGADGRTPLLSRLQARLNRRLAPRYDGVIVKSEQMARCVAPTPAHVVPNGVDLESFAPMERTAARRRLGWDLQRRYVLFPGNADNPRKGWPLARQTVDLASRTLGVPIEMPVLHGVGPDRVALYMNGCDAVLFTSFREGSPNVVKEAMGCNVPVVSVPVGDTAEMLAGVEQCAVRPYAAEPLAAALVEVLAQGGSSNGRRILVQRGLDLGSVARRVVSIYEDVLQGRSVRTRAPWARQDEPSLTPHSGG